MKLYHFMCDHVAPGVRLGGLTEGSIAIPAPGLSWRIKRGYQWLTAEPDWSKQRWADKVQLSCDRTDYRATVEIPGFQVFGMLRDWKNTRALLRDFRWTEEMLAEHERPGCENWYTFEGRIPRAWIVAIDENPRRLKEQAKQLAEKEP